MFTGMLINVGSSGDLSTSCNPHSQIPDELFDCDKAILYVPLWKQAGFLRPISPLSATFRLIICHSL